VARIGHTRAGYDIQRTVDFDGVSDAELLVLARTQPRAFGEFYRRHVRDVQSYFRRRVGNVETAFDLTAETFAAALRAVPRYEPRPEPARAWLFAIARHVLSESVRGGQVQDQARRALAMQPLTLDERDVRTLELLADTPALEAARALPADQRAAVFARHVDEESYAEIAERLDCSESVIRQRVSRGLRTLKARLEDGR
jgi:RNA polymerase sigma-70 factor (ECF subfamily)